LEKDLFRIRAHVADFDAIVQDLAAASLRTRETLSWEADIAYGAGPDETLDIFFPDGARSRRPVHMFIHGGYWRMFSKLDYSYVADTVTRSGAIAVIVDYSLMPAVRMNVLIDQVRRAKQWVTNNIEPYGGDPHRLTISGHSAGAHLATFLFHHPAATPQVKAALLLGGIYDLNPLLTSFLAAEIGITDEEAASFSPLKHKHDPSCVVTVAVGAQETSPFHEQAGKFAALLERQNVSVSLQSIQEANHMSSVRDLGLPQTSTGALLGNIIASA
jgi:arylformamidase